MFYIVRPINIYPYLTYMHEHRLKTPEQLADDIKELMDEASSLNAKLHVVLLDVIEGRIYSEDVFKMLLDVERILKSFDIEYTIILDGDNESHSVISGIDHIVYSDFMVMSCYANSILSPDQDISESWNNDKLKGLWMVGRAERPHRAPLMSKLWESKLLDTIDWSFYIYESNRDYIRKTFLIHYDDKTFDRFVSDTARTLDFTVPINDLSFTGFPFDVTLYKNTSFSIITESDFGINDANGMVWIPKLTEKTYRTIINRHPFICAWYPGMLDKIKNKGYRTFEEYTVDPNYNTIPDLNLRLDAVVKNIQCFQSYLNDPNNVDKVRDDIEHNYQQYLKNLEAELSKLAHIFELPQISHLIMTPTSLARFIFPRTTALLGKPSDIQ
jgi:hypothetical protein